MRSEAKSFPEGRKVLFLLYLLYLH